MVWTRWSSTLSRRISKQLTHSTMSLTPAGPSRSKLQLRVSRWDQRREEENKQQLILAGQAESHSTFCSNARPSTSTHFPQNSSGSVKKLGISKKKIITLTSWRWYFAHLHSFTLPLLWFNFQGKSWDVSRPSESSCTWAGTTPDIRTG